ncbi:MAG: FAD-binding oxidoreductase [Rhodospirillaceae bacterium]|nr:FAD-binding oxidoreductase [Rhodospirillaceae bacterium]
MTHYRFAIVGAGIAGASAGYHLAAAGPTLLIERESQPGYHSTGRSAALYTETYGNRVIRAVTIASRPFFEAPPPGFTEHPLLTPRGTLVIARADQRPQLEEALAEARAAQPAVYGVSREQALNICPVLKPGYVDSGFFEEDAQDMDVHSIHQGFLKGFRAAGGQLVCDAAVMGIVRANGGWTIETRAGTFTADIVVDAAGAWADVLAGMAGAKPIGLVPKRRTAITFEPPAGADFRRWPAVIDVEEQFYFKPDAAQLMASPADETPVDPQDIQPEEMDIAICIDRCEQAAALGIRRVTRKWAGLRSFVADKTPVVGFAAETPGFFWLAGQGGYGIMTSPTMGRIAAALAQDKPMPSDVQDLGVSAADLSPARLA